MSGCEKSCSGCASASSKSCGGNHCGACCGGGYEITLSQPEIDILTYLSQFCFAPVKRDRQTGELSLPVPELTAAAFGDALAALAAKNLVTVDDIPLRGYDYGDRSDDYDRGSAALTARGQDAVDSMQIQGVDQTC